jgi:hypothetical protein
MSSAAHYYDYKAPIVPGGLDLVNLNELQNPFTVSASVNIVSGSASYFIEFTMDDTTGDASTFSWFPHPATAPGQSASAIFNLSNLPVTGIRLRLDAITGEVKFVVIQSPASL